MNIKIRQNNYTVFAITLSFVSLIILQSATAKSACPANNPKEFVNRIMENKKEQSRYAKIPFIYTYVEQIGEIIRDKSVIIWKFEKIPYVMKTGGRLIIGKRDMNRYKLESNISRSNNGFKLKIYQPDTDYVLEYNFDRKNSCWLITALDNRSL